MCETSSSYSFHPLAGWWAPNPTLHAKCQEGGMGSHLVWLSYGFKPIGQKLSNPLSWMTAEKGECIILSCKLCMLKSVPRLPKSPRTFSWFKLSFLLWLSFTLWFIGSSCSGMGKLWPGGHMWPVKLFNLACLTFSWRTAAKHKCLTHICTTRKQCQFVLIQKKNVVINQILKLNKKNQLQKCLKLNVFLHF